MKMLKCIECKKSLKGTDMDKKCKKTSTLYK